MQESKCPRYTGLAAEQRIGVSSPRVRSSRAHLRLRSFTGEQQEIWRHQSRRAGSVQETRPGDKLVSLTGELGPGGGGGKQAAKHRSPAAGRDRWIYPYHSPGQTPHTQLIAPSHVPCHLAITDGLRPEGSPAVPTCSLPPVVVACLLLRRRRPAGCSLCV